MAKLYRGALGFWGFTLVGSLGLAACGGGTRTADSGSAAADSSFDRSTVADVGADSTASFDGGVDGGDLDSSSQSDASDRPPLDGGAQADPNDAGSVDGLSCDLPVGIDGASSDASPFPPDATSGAAASCEHGGFLNVGDVEVGPSLPEGATWPSCSGPCLFSFTVNDHRLSVPAEKRYSWSFALLGSGTREKQPFSELHFSTTWGWDVSWAPGQTLQGQSLTRMATCPGTGVDGVEGFPALAHRSLRDDAGRLLLLSVIDVFLAPNGEVLVDPAFAPPEMSLVWKDLCCPAYQGPGVGSNGGGHRMVGLVVRDAVTGDQAIATSGHDASVRIQGETYILSVLQAWVYAEPGHCGHAAFSIYREGYFSRVSDD